jgi:hypothetical protein
MAHSKTGNGVNVPDEFSIGKLPAIPTAARGRVAEPLDQDLIARIRTKLTSADDAIIGQTLYSATVAELTDYNKDNDHPITSLVALAKRFAFNASGNLRRHVAVVAAERKQTVGFRAVNEGTDDRPAVRWYIIITQPKPRQADAAKV